MANTGSDSDPDFEVESSQSSPANNAHRTSQAGQAESPTFASSSQTVPFEISSPVYYPHQSVPLVQNDSDGEPSSSSSSRLQRSSASPFQIPSHLVDKPFASESSYFVRPNRYFGPAATWRTWTEADRAIATAIDRQKATDLSRHLYNAYALKARAGSGNEDARGRQKKKKGKEPAEPMDEEDPTAEAPQAVPAFKPPRLWTAWPLPPNEVPREGLLPDIHPRGWRVARDTRPSAALEECLIALVARHAREKWEAREWNDSPSPLTNLRLQRETQPPKDGVVNDVSMQDESNLEEPDPDTSVHDINGSIASSSIQQNDDMSSSSEDVQPSGSGPQVFSSQMYEDVSDSVSSSDGSEREQRPMFTIDDDKVRKLVLPSVRHIITQIDEILRAVHVSRQSYAYGYDRSRSRSASKGVMDDQGNTSRNTSKSNRTTNEMTEDENFRYGPEQDVNPDIEHVTSSTLRPKSQARSEPLNPHDWSSIVGMASIVQAFEPSTIAKASERCAKLFDENMLFRTFHESGSDLDFGLPDSTNLLDAQTRTNNGPWFEEDFIIDDEDVAMDLYDELSADAKGSVIVTRMSEACVQCKRAKTECAPVTSLQDTSQQSEGVDCARCVQEGYNCSTIDVVLASSAPSEAVDRCCPYEYCERHSVPFKMYSSLKQHIRLSHVGEDNVLIMSREDSRKRSYSSMRGSAPAVRNEPYFCPVQSCPRSVGGSGVPFQIGSRLYSHLRKVHPKVDVNMVKQLELQKRGERRGRWTDERRHRSRSQNGRSCNRTEEESSVDDNNEHLT